MAHSSAAQSLDLDSIALCLAPLATSDFSRAARACRSWCSAAHRRSAWPVAPSSIAELHALSDVMAAQAELWRDSVASNSARHSHDRCITVNSVTLAGLSSLWIHATQIDLVPVPPRCGEVMQNLSRFTQLTALSIRGDGWWSRDITDCFSAIRSRLAILHVDVSGRDSPISAQLLTELPVLRHLRVLVLTAPATGFVPLPALPIGKRLAPCPFLQSLRLHHFNVDSDSFATMRQLLAQGSIRHLSVVKWFSDFDLAQLVSQPESAPLDFSSVTLESLSLNVSLLWDSCPAVFMLPSLQSLRLLRSACSNRLFADQPFLEFKPLQLLTSIDLAMTLSAYQLSVIANRAPNLQSLKCEAVEPDLCCSLRSLPSLTHLETSVDTSVERGRSTIEPLFVALAALPSFSKLVLHLPHPTDLSAFVSVQCRSPSWSQIVFSGDDVSVGSAVLIVADADQLRRLQSIRWKLLSSGREQSYRLWYIAAPVLPGVHHTLCWAID